MSTPGKIEFLDHPCIVLQSAIVQFLTYIQKWF
jgi:hypothetical protein